MRAMRLLVLLGALVGTFTVAGDAEIGIDGFKPAIDRLVSRESPGSFLIIQEAGTGKFVQFSNHPDNGLALDLPVDGLSDQEQQRASLHLVNRGAEFMSWQVDGHRMQAYVKQLGRDTEQAARLATLVMREVYGFGDDAVYTLVEQ